MKSINDYIRSIQLDSFLDDGEANRPNDSDDDRILYYGHRLDYSDESFPKPSRGRIQIYFHGKKVFDQDEMNGESDVEWGYRGSAPLRLSRFILEDYIPEIKHPQDKSDEDWIFKIILEFRRKFVCLFPLDCWEIRENTLHDWIESVL